MTFVPGLTPPATESRRVWFVFHGNSLVVRPEPDAISLPRDDQLTAAGVALSSVEYLGQLDGEQVFAAITDAAPPAPLSLRDLRGLYGALGDEAYAVAGRATQIVQWAATHRFCGRCGSPTRRVPTERAMHCDACGLSFFPRLAPAIMVLVRRGDEALLAHGARFPLPMYSALAGFVEAGESLEETLAREVREEVGIEVRNLRYFGSQPWPYPNSLMICFFADWAGGEIVVDGDEIVDAKWFSADELPLIPPRLSISRQLIDAWLAEVRK